jgi:hypothetical protein
VPPVISSRIVEIRPAVSASDHPFEKTSEPLPPPPSEPLKQVAAPSAEAVPVPEEIPTSPPAAEAAVEAAAPATPAPEPKKRSPRKPKPAPEPAPAAPEPLVSASEPPASVTEDPAPAPSTPETAAPTEEIPAPAAAASVPAPELILESPAADEPAQPASPDISEPAISSDGATRLVVTAYIGIGNRIFIRGEGPGLSWEKGVPLNFISIGKWRWESHDATSTVRFKLYKNDQVECTALGETSVEPGAQRELSASF